MLPDMLDCHSIRRCTWRGTPLPQRLRLHRAYRWKQSAKCWDINGSPRPKSTLKLPMTRSAGYGGVERETRQRLQSRFIQVYGLLVFLHAFRRYYFAVLRFFLPKLACSSGSCSFRYCLKHSGCRPNSAATFAVVSPPSFNRAMASAHLAAVAGLYLRTDDQSTGLSSS